MGWRGEDEEVDDRKVNWSLVFRIQVKNETWEQDKGDSVKCRRRKNGRL
jgi:hypothetical protein